MRHQDSPEQDFLLTYSCTFLSTTFWGGNFNDKSTQRQVALAMAHIVYSIQCYFTCDQQLSLPLSFMVCNSANWRTMEAYKTVTQTLTLTQNAKFFASNNFLRQRRTYQRKCKPQKPALYETQILASNILSVIYSL